MNINNIPLINSKYKLLEQEIVENNFRSALLIVKDCWEIIIKFSAIILYCDLWELLRDDSENSRNLVKLLQPLFIKFPSMGDWLSFWVELSSYALTLNCTEKLNFPNLVGIIYKTNIKRDSRPKPTKFFKLLRSAIEWRNNIIGHGAASHSEMLLSDDINQQVNSLNTLMAEYELLNQTEVISLAPNGNLINWSDFNSLVPLSDTDNEEQYFKVYIQSNAFKLVLSPLIVARADRKHLSLLTFDKLSGGILFLDYILGTKIRYNELKILDIYMNQLAESDRLESMDGLSSGRLLDSKAQAYSIKVTNAFDRIEFGSDLKQWFVMPDHLRNNLYGFLEACEIDNFGGYFHIAGGAGRGKSWFTANLKNNKVFEYASEAIVYHIRIGMRQNSELFISSVQNQVHSETGHQVLGARIRLEEFETEYDAFIDFVKNVLDASVRDRFILVIDGLDELLESDSAKETSRSIINFLPPPEKMIDGLAIVISSRHEVELRPQVKEFIDSISTHKNYFRYDIDAFYEKHNSTINLFLESKFKIVNDRIRHQIIKKSDNSFLKATLFGRLYVFSSRTNIADLPDDIYNLYDIYLKDKANIVGKQLFNQLHRKLLQVLSVSPYALTIDQLAELLKIQEENIVFSLFDIGEFFHIERSMHGNSFQLAHGELAQYLRVSNKDEILALIHEMLELYFNNNTQEMAWFVESTEFLQGIAQTNLCLSLCNILLKRMDTDSLYRIALLRRAIDMDHIKGNYRRAAESLDQLAKELSSSNTSPASRKEIWKIRVRQAHHLKFISHISEGIKIIKGVLKEMPENEHFRLETEFTLYGSLGCLSNPSLETLERLKVLAEQATQQGDEYLLVRCLRHIAGLNLLFGKNTEAMETAKKAMGLIRGTENRQSVYLNSTIAEIYRCTGDLEAALFYHHKTIQSAGFRGLKGWQGHGHLGSAEVLRMKGIISQAEYHLKKAEKFYR
ncbi:MAG: hypothetical protein HQK65_07820, partial [Desulfamplus sp.]|nr:hypothetical protein [Desulfamplus sp.]